MKINGKTFAEPFSVNEFITRSVDGSKGVMFTAQSVIDYTEFELLVDKPKPPKTISKGRQVENFDDPTYSDQEEEYTKKRHAWMCIKSLEATEGGIEWETVDMQDPDTWEDWREELSACGFNEYEVGRVYRAISRANGIDQDFLDEARERFLAQQVVPVAENSQSENDHEPLTI